jgi:urease gamma subunit
MVFRVVLFLWEFLMDVLVVSRLSDEEKELEILLLRQQLRIVEGRQERGPQISRWQKVPLAVLAVRLKERARNGRAALETSMRLFRPATVIGRQVRPEWALV